MTPIFLRPSVRPYLILVGVVVLLAAIDAGNSGFLTVATAYSALQSFSTFGLVAVGFWLTMLIGEFDPSTAGVFGLAGCVALITGAENAGLGLLSAVGVGGAFGFAQGIVITSLNLGSVSVTLGGLLTASGLAYVVTHNQSSHPRILIWPPP